MRLTSDALRTVLAALLSAAAWPFLQLIQQFTSIKTSFTAFLIITQWLGTVPFHKRFIFHVYAVDVQITEKWRFCCIVYFDIATFRMLECYWSVYTWVVPEMCPTSQPIVVSCRDCLRCQTHFQPKCFWLPFGEHIDSRSTRVCTKTSLNNLYQALWKNITKYYC